MLFTGPALDILKGLKCARMQLLDVLCRRGCGRKEQELSVRFRLCCFCNSITRLQTSFLMLRGVAVKCEMVGTRFSTTKPEASVCPPSENGVVWKVLAWSLTTLESLCIAYVGNAARPELSQGATLYLWSGDWRTEITNPSCWEVLLRLWSIIVTGTRGVDVWETDSSQHRLTRQ